jgi:hypothetical protein
MSGVTETKESPLQGVRQDGIEEEFPLTVEGEGTGQGPRDLIHKISNLARLFLKDSA